MNIRRLILVLSIIASFAVGTLWGSIMNPLSYTSGFLDSYTSAPQECREQILGNYFYKITHQQQQQQVDVKEHI